MRKSCMTVRGMLFVCLALVVTLSVSMSFPSGVVRAAGDTVYPITYGNEISYYAPQIDGNHMVWIEDGEIVIDGDEEDYQDIYLYDYDTKEFKVIAYDVDAGYLVIHGDAVVWSDSGNGSIEQGIYKYSIANKTTEKIIDESRVQGLTVSGASDNLISYTTYKDGLEGVVIYDLDKGAAATVTSIFEAKNMYDMVSTPSIDGNLVVWSVENNMTGSFVYLYDLSKPDGSPEIIGSGIEPVISADYVVWKQWEGAVWKLSLYNVATETEKVIALDENTDVDRLVISGQNVAWVDEEGYKINLYDISTGKAKTVADIGDSYVELSISGDTLLWSKDGNIYANKDHGSLLNFVNTTVSNVAKMKDVMESKTLGLKDYPEWMEIDRKTAAADFLDRRPDDGFATLPDLQTAMDQAIVARTPVANVNIVQDGEFDTAAQEVQALRAALVDDSLLINRGSFEALEDTDQEAVLYTLLAIKASTHDQIYWDNAFDDEAAIQEALDSAVQKWTSSVWKYVGSPGSAWGETSLVVANGIPYVGFQDDNFPGHPTVKSFNGTAWTTLGGATLSTEPANVQIALNSKGELYAAFRIGNYSTSDIMVKKYEGSSWHTVSNVGEEKVNRNGDFSFAIDNNDVPYVAFLDYDYDANRSVVMKWNGTVWVEVGDAPPSDNRVTDIQLIAMDGVLYLAYVDNDDQQAVIKTLDGGTWKTAGKNAIGGGTALVSAVDLEPHNGSLYIAYINGNDSKVRVEKLDVDGNWAPVGDTIGNGESNAYSASISLAFQGNDPIVAYTDKNLNDNVTVKFFDGTEWKLIGEAGFTDSAVKDISMTVDHNHIYLSYRTISNALSNQATIMKTTIQSPINPVNGDLNGDGEITPADALLITKYLSGKTSMSKEEAVAAYDMNGDGEVDADDVKAIMSIYLGV